MKKIIVSILSIIFFGACSSDSATDSQPETTKPPVVVDPPVTTPVDPPLGPLIAINLGANGFITTKNSNSNDAIVDGKLANWTSLNTITSVYLWCGKTGKLNVSLKGYVAGNNTSTIKVSIKDLSYNVTMNDAASKVYSVGTFIINTVGYVKIDIQGISKTGTYIADLTDVLVNGSAVDGTNNCFFVPLDNAYFGRRGPSVHITYDVNSQTDNEWNYSEVTIPEGQDVVGTYYMANGFDGGYFGIQVNSPNSVPNPRRVLFSVWTPVEGQAPYTELVSKGANVISNGFSGEGSGVQTYLYANLKTNVTYKFLNRAVPDGNGSTLFSAWFFDPIVGNWQFIATIKRPLLSSYLKGWYSFLENFVPDLGYITRKANYGNQWYCTKEGQWYEVTGAKFSIDDTGNTKQRLDYNGGVSGNNFYLENCGFFNPTVSKGAAFSRTANGVSPNINFASLPNYIK